MTRPPEAKQIPRITEIHGYTLQDDYAWLREKGMAEVIQHLEAENAYTEALLAPMKPLQESLYAEMLGRIKQTDLSVPAKNGDYWYYSRTEEGKQYPIMCRRRGTMDGAEETILDLNALAEGHSFLGVGAYTVSNDANWLAYSLDTTGYRTFTLHVKDLRTGTVLPRAIDHVGSVVWANDNRTLFLTTEDDVTKRSDKFWRHIIGTDVQELVYEEKDELYDLAAGRSLDRRMLFVGAYAKTSREIRYLDADTPAGEFTVVLTREADHEYDVDHNLGEFYITTNKGAKNFKVVRAPIADASEANWTTVIPHDPAVKIEGLSFFVRHIIVSERERGLNYLRVIDADTNASHRITADEDDYAMGMGANLEFETDAVRYTYQSMVTPPSVYEYHLDTRARALLKQQEVLGGFDPSLYESTRVWVTARDGAQVPLSLVRKRGVALDGSAPLLLYAYGSYGISLGPTFSSARISLLDRGMIYGIAYIRGGGELGEEWREQGRMMRKMNTFQDFVDCAEYLVTSRYTSPDRLVIQGGSAGGLLVAAAANMRPGLFKAVVAQVPFVDVINTMLDATLPLTTSEYIEWGNPNEKDAFDYMLQYSPYDNIKAQDYPAMLMQASLHDSQVPYWEAAKFVSKLRRLKTDANPVLLKTNMGAGHGGASGRYDALRETAFTYTFILWQVGLAAG